MTERVDTTSTQNAEHTAMGDENVDSSDSEDLVFDRKPVTLDGTAAAAIGARNKVPCTDVVPYVSQTPPSPTLQFMIPNFNLRAWNPVRGMDFLSLMGLPEPSYPQTDHVCKMKTSTARRRVRRHELVQSSVLGRIDEKKFHQAVAMNDEKAVEEALDRGINPCLADDRKRTALHIAAAKGHANIVSILVNRGANPNQKDCLGNTPLHLAVCSNQVEVVSILLAAGTDLMSLNNHGRTPMHLAQSRINILQRELKQGYSTDLVKDKVMKVADMMNRYLRVSGDEESVDQLTQLCAKLQLTKTAEELCSVNELLGEFTSLNIRKPAPPKR